MAITLIVYDNLPTRFAATKVGTTVPDGRFFLDFTRNLEVIRWFGVRNRFVGPAVTLLVPIVHEGEKAGGNVIGVSAGDPYFQDLRKLWKVHFPSLPFEVSQEADGLKIIADMQPSSQRTAKRQMRNSPSSPKQERNRVSRRSSFAMPNKKPINFLQLPFTNFSQIMFGHEPAGDGEPFVFSR